MACRCGGTFLTPILAIAGLVAAGAAGYRVISGGCGSCKDDAAKTTLVSTDKGDCALCDTECSGHEKTACEGDAKTVAASGKSECCMGKDSGAVKTVAAEAKSECCMAGKDGAAVKTVAAEAKTEKKEGCCSGEKTQAAECTGVSGCEGEKKEGCCSEEKKEEKKAEGTVAGK